jgi:hypothetical protein
MASTTKFGFVGGSDNDLCHRLADVTQEPTIILAEPKRNWPKTDLEYDDLADLKVQILKKFTLDDPTLKTWGLSGAAYPEDFYFIQRRQYYREAFDVVKPKAVVTDGKITLSTPDGAVPLNAMFSKPLKKRVSWHWFFENAMLVGDVRNATQEAYVKCIADALGAKLVERETGYYLDFDPNRYRARARALLDRLSKSTRCAFDSTYAYTSVCIRCLSDEQLITVFKSPNGELEIDFTKSQEVQLAARRRLETIFPVRPDNIRRDETAYTTWNLVSPKMDFSRLPYTVARASGYYGLKYFGKPEDYCEWFF